MLHTFCLYRRTELRRRKVEDVVAEMEAVSSLGRVLIMDPAMPSTPQWTEELCEQLTARKINVHWRADAKLVQCDNPEKLTQLKDAGCYAIMLAIESLDAETSQRVKGDTSPQQLKTGIKNLKRAGIAPVPVFFVGFPWDSSETLEKIGIFLREVAVPSFILKQVRPWRGTQLYQEYKELGLLKRDLGIDDYVHSDYPILGTLTLSREEVEDWKYRIRKGAILNWRYVWSFLLERKRIRARQVKLFLRLVMGMKWGWDES